MDKRNYWADLERENLFKACNAKQGPLLIHLANLRVMYECRSTLVRGVQKPGWLCMSVWV